MSLLPSFVSCKLTDVSGHVYLLFCCFILSLWCLRNYCCLIYLFRLFEECSYFFLLFRLVLLISAKMSSYHHLHWSLQQHLHLPVCASVWSLWVLNMDQLYFGVLNFTEDILELVFYEEISQSENVFFQGNFLHVVKKPTTIHSHKYASHSFFTTI